MIIFIQSIWQLLDDTHRIIVITTGIIMLACIAWFIYGIIRKPLYAIPNILRKIHTRIMELSSNLSPSNIPDEQLINFITLSPLNNTQYLSLLESVTDISSAKKSAGDFFQSVDKGNINLTPDNDTTRRLERFMFEKLGLEQALENDTKVYQKLKKQLDKIQIPNKEIGELIIKYENTSKSIGTWTPWLHIPNTKGAIAQIYPLNYKIDSKIMIDDFSNSIKLLPAQITEAIEKYYKGDNNAKKES